VLDAWGNPTAPMPELPFSVAVASTGLEPGQAAFPVSERGVAAVSGLAARRADAPPPLSQPGGPSQPPAGGGGGASPQVHDVKIWPQVEGLPPPRAVEAAGGAGGASEEEEALALAVVARSAYGEGLAAAVAAPPAPVAARLGVLPSTMPAKLMFVYQVRGRGRRGAGGADVWANPWLRLERAWACSRGSRPHAAPPCLPAGLLSPSLVGPCDEPPPRLGAVPLSPNPPPRSPPAFPLGPWPPLPHPPSLPPPTRTHTQGEVLQMVEEPGEDDGEPTIVWVLSGRAGLAAGGRAEGLALRCLDQVGRPSRQVKGKLQVRRRAAAGAPARASSRRSARRRRARSAAPFSGLTPHFLSTWRARASTPQPPRCRGTLPGANRPLPLPASRCPGPRAPTSGASAAMT
jgi:hypothetical protein